MGQGAPGQTAVFLAGIAMLDITRRRWLPILHPKRGVDVQQWSDDSVEEHRTGHAMVPAERGLLVIGGRGYNGMSRNDVLHIGLF